VLFCLICTNIADAVIAINGKLSGIALHFFLSPKVC
jgi:hypothetical protein